MKKPVADESMESNVSPNRSKLNLRCYGAYFDRKKRKHSEDVLSGLTNDAVSNREDGDVEFF
eukprot:10607714-Karenia_brevis.AAC.1